ncbi:MAG: 30S ribosomal protein S17 [Planctomycetes bacterium]|nr:30S ribosomal protein S17 [Planctomycetota bacterium]
MKERGRRRRATGVVVSDKMDKSIVVEVERIVRHPKYEKTLRLRRKHKAHDEKNEAAMGDWVEIVEARPMSKTKCWRLMGIVRKVGGVIEIKDELAPEEEGAERHPQGASADAPAREDESSAPETEESGDSGPDQA